MPVPPPIEPAETSVTAFVGRARTGPVHEPARISSYDEYERTFGGLSQDSAMSLAVHAFYENGGSQALIVRLEPAQSRPARCRWLRRQASSSLQASDYIGENRTGQQTGLYALAKGEHFNLLCLPEELAGGIPPEVVAAAAQLCEQRRAMLLLDPPPGWTSPATAAAGVRQIGTASRNAAVFFPRLRMADPANGGQVKEFGPSAAVAGIYARLDRAQGVWKAPAGTEAAFYGAVDVSTALTSRDIELLNPLGINCLRTLPDGSRVIWGARTLAADPAEAEWKYISVRRWALFIEESIYQGTQWAVFEPNDEPLWAQVRQATASFLHTLFVQGAFPGNKPEQAYFVKCGRDTMTQADIDAGRINIMVGIAPIRPAEFIIIRIGLTKEDPPD